MKIAGFDLSKPNEEVVVIPRGDQNIPFVAQAVLTYDEFDKYCPEPAPPEYIGEGGKKVIDWEDVEYRQSMVNRSSYRMSWIVLESLKNTPGLNWSNIDMTKPKTWPTWQDELRAANFSIAEINRIQNAVFAANCLSEDRVKEARDAFLSSRAEQAAK